MMRRLDSVGGIDGAESVAAEVAYELGLEEARLGGILFMRTDLLWWQPTGCGLRHCW